MTSDNNNHNNNNRVLEGKWRALAILNMINGGIVLIVQIVTLSTLYNDWVDWIGIGIWGGCFMISAGSLTLQRSPRLISMTVCALLSGLALIIFYGWNLGAYYNASYDSHYGYYCHNNNSYWNYSSELCDWRVASDIIFIVCGSVGLIINLVLSANTKTIVVFRPMVRYPMNAYPMTTTNTTYLVTRPATSYPQTQTVYQVPVTNYPMQSTGVVYQTTTPGYPVMQQQQPMYYQPNNPPTYPPATTTYPPATTTYH